MRYPRWHTIVILFTNSARGTANMHKFRKMVALTVILPLGANALSCASRASEIGKPQQTFLPTELKCPQEQKTAMVLVRRSTSGEKRIYTISYANGSITSVRIDAYLGNEHQQASIDPHGELTSSATRALKEIHSQVDLIYINICHGSKSKQEEYAHFLAGNVERLASGYVDSDVIDPSSQ